MFVSLLITLFVTLSSAVFGYDEAEIVFVGDAMQHQSQIDAGRTGKSSYDFSTCFDDVVEYIGRADFAVVNLETPIGPPPHTGYPSFNAPSEFVDALKDAGFDLFLTANNHTLDRGARGLRSTIRELDARGLAHLGTYGNDSSRHDALPMIFDINGIKVGFLNYTYGTNGVEPRDGVVVDYIDRATIKADVEASRKAGAELVAVCIHWGDEYRLLPNASQKHTADFLEAMGVDMIIGAHPHVIQPIEFRTNRYMPDKKVLLVYSLGNFISNMKTTDTRGGALVRVLLERGDDRKARLKLADYRLLFVIPGTSPKNNYRVMPVDSVKADGWRQKSIDFSRRARDIYDRHNIGVSETR